MPIRFDNYLGSNPYLYAREIIRKCGGIKHPPVDLEKVADVLRLKIKYFFQPGEFTLEKHKTLIITPSWLDRKNRKIWIYKNMPRTRQRISIPHEMMHDANPCHQDIDPDDPGETDFFNINRQEQEAFRGASWLMFLLGQFVERILSFRETRMANINNLAAEHMMSPEATAIWYAYTHPGLCGFMVSEPVELAPQKQKASSQDSELPFAGLDHLSSGSKTPLWLTQRTYGKKLLKNGVRFPMRVKYAVLSNRFPKRFIRSGTLIPQTSIIYDVYRTGTPRLCDIPARDIGSSSPVRYNAECIPYELNGDRKVWTLLWLPDKQINFKLPSPYIGW